MKSLDITNSHLQIALSKRTLIKNSSSSSQVKLRSSKRTLGPNSRKNSDLHSKNLKMQTCQSIGYSNQKQTENQSVIETPPSNKKPMHTTTPLDIVSKDKASHSQAPSLSQNFSAKDIKYQGTLHGPKLIL